MVTQEIEITKTCLAELVAAAEHGDELLLTKDGRPFARLVPAGRDRVPGSARGLVTIRDDFDDPLDDFRDYM